MAEITTGTSLEESTTHVSETLFNDLFLSDVQFLFGDRVLYAHSWMLMNRSSVFQKQLKPTMGTQNMIRIEAAEYSIFYQFIRFLYTYDCDITAENKIGLLKLAVHYKVSTLEMILVNIKSIAIADHLKLFEYCVVNKYKMAKRYTHDLIKFYLRLVLQSDQFTLIHPDVLETILKFDDVGSGVREINLFNALVRWINAACVRDQIPIEQCRTHFEKFLRLIRFSAMTVNEFRECRETNPDLILEDDAVLLSIFGDGTKSRLPYMRPYETRRFLQRWRMKTIFKVNSDAVLYALRYGIKFHEATFEVRINARHLTTNHVEKLNLNFAPSTEIIILGDSYVLKPNFEYTFDVNYNNTEEEFKIFTRRRSTNVIVNGPRDLVEIVEVSANLIEMFFKTITNAI